MKEVIKRELIATLGRIFAGFIIYLMFRNW